MREKLHIIAVLLLFGLVIALANSGRKVSATNTGGTPRTAYVDTAKKALVLHFKGFSKKDKYTYVISSKGEVVARGTASPNGIYPLKEKYEEDTVYQLKIRSEEDDTLTVYYYTCNAMAGYRATQIRQNIKCTWNVKKKSAYDGYYARICKKNAISPELEKRLNDGAEIVGFRTASFENGEYEARVIAHKTIDGNECYGQGFVENITIIRVPTRVTGIKSSANTRRVKLTWNPAAGASYYKVYKATSAGGKYTLARDKVKTNACIVHYLSGGKKYYFKVEAVAAVGRKTVTGPRSVAKAQAVPLVAGKVEKVKPYMDGNKEVFLKWDKTKHATGYYVYYRKATDKGYTKLGGTTNNHCSLKKLSEDANYKIVVYAFTKIGTRKYISDSPSTVLSLNPVRDTDYIISSEVRTIGFVGRHREVYTTKKYSAKVKTAYVNSRGYKSPTQYLIWVSHYTQQASIFKGSKGKWKMIRSFSVATGRAWTRSPRGVFKIGRKEHGWYYVYTQVLYVTHYHGENSFHTRPLYKGGGVATPTLNRPASHGCVRCPTSDAKFIYNKIPAGTTVVSW